jgi:tRNA pseudouridine55 synthase
MMNGIINVYKERGFTSFDVVAKLRGILRERKIGHTGTLDPEATGVLPVCIGNATKVCELLTDKDKVYEAVLHIGVTTDTQDATGTVLEKREQEAAQLSEEAVREAVLGFVGGYEQIPPMYSALKVNGRKLCDLAREGIVVERKARPVRIYSIAVTSVELPFVSMRVHCSKGTYIRTLCEDIGKKLGVGGCMESLERTRVSVFTREEALTLAEIEEYRDRNALEEILMPVDAVFEGLPKAHVKPEAMRFLQNGNLLAADCFAEALPAPDEGGQLLVYDSQGHFYAVYQYDSRKKAYKVRKMFGAGA